MADGINFGASYTNLENSIRRASIEQKMIAANIANIQSDNYTKNMFQVELDKARRRRENKKILLDEEMAKMAKNNLKMTSYVQLLTKKIQILKKVATLGKSG